MDKVYVVICGLNQSCYQDPSEESWVVSVHRTEVAAQQYVREQYTRQLQEELNALTHSEGYYQPELRNFWRYKSYALEN